MVNAYNERGKAPTTLSPAGSSSTARPSASPHRPTAPASPTYSGAPWPSQGTTASPTASPPASSSSASASVVGSRIRFIYHRSSCEWARKISARNRVYFSSSAEASQKGYRACRVCRP
ncbi:MAG: hypothetical protein K8J09_11725 [Planctomycetes bacterium]|nr:hypothetical protein [Planctomycetota bacterium]